MTNTILLTEIIRYWSFTDVRHKAIRRRRREAVTQLRTLCNVGAIRRWVSTSSPGSSTCTKKRGTVCTWYRRLGGPKEQSGRERKISSPPGFNPLPIQPVASFYNHYAVLTGNKTHFLRSWDTPKSKCHTSNLSYYRTHCA